MVHTLAMLIVNTTDGDIPHKDAESWSVTVGDERLVVLGPDNASDAQTEQRVLAEYARGSWQHVRREDDPAETTHSTS